MFYAAQRIVVRAVNVFECCGEALVGAIGPRFHRTDRNPELFGDLRMAQTGERAETHDVSFSLWQRVDRPADLPQRPRPLGRRRWVVGVAVATVEPRRLDVVGAAVATDDVECAVAGDREQPRSQGTVRIERVAGVPGLDEGRLSGIGGACPVADDGHRDGEHGTAETVVDGAQRVAVTAPKPFGEFAVVGAHRPILANRTGLRGVREGKCARRGRATTEGDNVNYVKLKSSATLAAAAAALVAGAGTAIASAPPSDGAGAGPSDCPVIPVGGVPMTTAAPDTSVAPMGSEAMADGPYVQIAVSEEFGEILVDGACRTLYMFDNDVDGEPTCVDQCLANWPILPAVDGAVPPLADELDASLFSVVEHPTAGPMLKVGDFPLYYYIADAGPGDIQGQAVGDVWWVVAPDGTPVTEAVAGTAETEAIIGDY